MALDQTGDIDLDAAPDAPLLFVAASGLAREAARAAWEAGETVIGCIDDDAAKWGTLAGPGLPVLGGVEEAGARPDARVVVCAGKGTARERIVARLTAVGVGPERYATVVHPAAHLAPDTRVGHGSIVLAGVVATTDVVLGQHVVCMPNVVLTHDDLVESFATLCAGVVLGGSVRVGRAAYLGMSCSVRERVSVGAETVIGMGAAVLDDVGDGETWVGVPARRLVR